MNKEARRAEIEALIREYKELDVNEIKRRFGISGVTVRNDLIDLERQGIVRRLFGKAVLNENKLLASLDAKMINHLVEKEKIGKYAASLIGNNSSILLYAGSTTLQIARYIEPKKKLIAVTNSIFIAYELELKAENANIVFIGGNLNPQTGATYGEVAVRQLDEYHIDILFMSADGIDIEAGITNDHPYETDINRAMIRDAEQVVMVADSSKIGKVGFVRIAQLSDIDLLITDAGVPDAFVQRMSAMNIKVMVV